MLNLIFHVLSPTLCKMFSSQYFRDDSCTESYCIILPYGKENGRRCWIERRVDQLCLTYCCSFLYVFHFKRKSTMFYVPCAYIKWMVFEQYIFFPFISSPPFLRDGNSTPEYEVETRKYVNCIRKKMSFAIHEWLFV